MTNNDLYQVSCYWAGDESTDFDGFREVWFRGTEAECEEWKGDGDIEHLAYPDGAFLVVEPADDAPLTDPH